MVASPVVAGTDGGLPTSERYRVLSPAQAWQSGSRATLRSKDCEVPEGRCPFSLDRILSVSDDGQVMYRAEKAKCQPFPILGNQELLRGISPNFEVLNPREFLAEITQHIPDPGMQMIRYYG